MTHTAAALVLSLVLLVAPAYVIVIPVEGTITGGVAGSDFRPIFNIRGDGFSYVGGGLFGSDPPFVFANAKPLNTPVDISHTLNLFEPGTLTINGVSETGFPVRGSLHFDIEPFVITAFQNPFPGTAPTPGGGESPFTVNGVISLNDRSVEVEGSGTLTYRGNVSLTPPGFEQFSFFIPQSYRYDRTPVPEPTTISFLATGLGLLGWRVRRGFLRS